MPSSAVHYARSKDGTSIACWRSGGGPPLVLVHGTTADHERWAPILPELEKRFTVRAVDRRGRGSSGDAPDYALEQEFEDIAAVVDAAGETAFVLGHSHGAICALGAALRTSKVRRLGGDSPPFFKQAIGALHSALPESSIEVLPGQTHAAIDAAPALFARAVVEFLS